MDLKLRDFKDKDFRIYASGNDWSWKLCQLRVYDETSEWWESNTKYFINVYISDYRLWDIWYRMKETYSSIKDYRNIVVKMQLYRSDLTIKLSISKDKEFHSIDQIIDLCDSIWRGLECNNDRYN